MTFTLVVSQFESILFPDAKPVKIGTFYMPY